MRSTIVSQAIQPRLAACVKLKAVKRNTHVAPYKCTFTTFGIRAIAVVSCPTQLAR